MKRIFCILCVFVVGFSNLNAQTICHANLLHKEDNKYYLIENGMKHPVNEKIVTVKFKKGKENLAKGMQSLRMNKLGYMDVKVPDSVSLERFANQLEKSGNYELIHFGTYGEISIVPNDAYIGNQWYLDSIKAFDTWNYTMGSSSVKIGIIDQLPSFSHQDIYTISAGYNNIDWSFFHDYTGESSPSYHGMSVAGVIGAKSNNSIGIAGICGGNNSAGTRILPYNVSAGGNSIDMSAVDDAIIKATDDGAKIINMSFRSLSSYHPDVDDAIEYAVDHGVVLFAASGNDYNSTWIGYPASHSDVIAVGSVGQNLSISLFSNRSDDLDLVAPGESIYTITQSDAYTYCSGTSFSSPILSGVAALMLSANPNLSASQVRYFLCNTARDLGSPGRDAVFGYGLVDAYAAVNAALAERITQINGPTIPGSASTYIVNNLPPSWNVTWSMQGKTSLPSYCTTNFPAANQLQINNSSKLHIKETLVAKVYKPGGTLVKTLTKSINTADGFTGTYSQTIPLPNQSTSGSLSDGCLLDVQQGYNVTLTSTDFNGATVTYDSFDTPTISSSGNIITFRFHTSTDFSFCLLHIVKGDKVIEFRLRANPSLIIDPILHITSGNSGDGDNSVIIELSENENSAEPLRNNAFDSWNLTIYSYSTGKIVHRQKVSGRSVSIATSTWEPDTYIVRIWIDDKEIVQKISIE